MFNEAYIYEKSLAYTDYEIGDVIVIENNPRYGIILEELSGDYLYVLIGTEKFSIFKHDIFKSFEDAKECQCRYKAKLVL